MQIFVIWLSFIILTGLGRSIFKGDKMVFSNRKYRTDIQSDPELLAQLIKISKKGCIK